jgi:two-component system, OmpR family, KDP operon response regulator KdpE
MQTRPQLKTTVLVVDDEPHVLAAVAVALEGRGYEVRTAPNGSMAIDSVSAERPDVVLLDLAMRGMDGIEVTRRLRGWSQVPIVVLSARTDERNKVRALDAGADDYVTKPFGTQELLARIRAALRREDARRFDQPVIRMPGLAIDLVARRVSIDDRDVHLTPTEFELLRVLATNPDRVLTHRYILTTVLGPAYENAVQNLRTFVGQLRRKIESDPNLPRMIVSEPGVGYRFQPRDSERGHQSKVRSLN